MDERKWDEEAVEKGKFEAFCQIVQVLRAPDGCPWDKVQTMESLKPSMIDETTEALAAIDICCKTGGAENLCEELGDVLLHVVLLAQIAQEEGLFTMEDVVRGVCRKMIRRHPHVFGAESASPAVRELLLAYVGKEEVPGLWETIKKEEKRNRTPEMKQMEREAFSVSAEAVIAHLKQKL